MSSTTAQPTPAARPSAAAKASKPHALELRLAHFMNRPQRHRLLHGFPLAAAMPFVNDQIRRRHRDGDRKVAVIPDLKKQLLVGVLPHPFCNPQLQGCGFCTFPHERFHLQRAKQVVDGVIAEVAGKMERHPELSGSEVRGLYFGGGTANLTPTDSFRQLTKKLGESFDLSQAEISLEGVPAYFVRRNPALVDVMREEIRARHFRISMGIQTFSDRWLERMGRRAFGDAATFAEAVKMAHDRQMTASGDLLINLPGQSLAEMKSDVAHAADIGLDQICIYHLVMFRGLGTPWSRNPALIEQLPSNEAACENWMAVREQLLGLGYQQTTLTNFERVVPRNGAPRYLYESLSFQPENCQMLGFGPAGISMVSYQGSDFKTMNPESAAAYLQALRSEGPTWNRYYQFDLLDQKLFHLTRHLAALQIDISNYQKVFQQTPQDDFGEELNVLEEGQLISRTPSCLQLTPKGMFYADSIAGILADQHFRVRRDLHVEANDNSTHYM